MDGRIRTTFLDISTIENKKKTRKRTSIEENSQEYIHEESQNYKIKKNMVVKVKDLFL